MYSKKSESAAIAFIESDFTTKKQTLYNVFLDQALKRAIYKEPIGTLVERG